MYFLTCCHPEIGLPGDRVTCLVCPAHWSNLESMELLSYEWVFKRSVIRRFYDGGQEYVGWIKLLSGCLTVCSLKWPSGQLLFALSQPDHCLLSNDDPILRSCTPKLDIPKWGTYIGFRCNTFNCVWWSVTL